METKSSTKQEPAPLKLKPVTVDETILDILKIPPPKYHMDALTGKVIDDLLPHSHQNLTQIAMCTYEFHLRLRKLMDEETDKAPASIVKLFKERRSGLISSIYKELRRKHDDFTGILSGRQLKSRETHLRSQITHAPEKLNREEYAQALAALQKAIDKPELYTPKRHIPFKAKMQGILNRELQSSRYEQPTESQGSDTSDGRKRRNELVTTTTETPRTIKRSRTTATNAMEELEIELFGSLDTDPSDNGEDEDEGEGKNEQIVEPQPPPSTRLPPLLLPDTPVLSLTMKQLDMKDSEHS